MFICRPSVDPFDIASNIWFSHQWKLYRPWVPHWLLSPNYMMSFAIDSYPVGIHGKADYLVYFSQQDILGDIVFYASHHLQHIEQIAITIYKTERKGKFKIKGVGKGPSCKYLSHWELTYLFWLAWISIRFYHHPKHTRWSFENKARGPNLMKILDFH